MINGKKNHVNIIDNNEDINSLPLSEVIELYLSKNRYDELYKYYYTVFLNKTLKKQKEFILELERLVEKYSDEQKISISEFFVKGENEYSLLNKVRLINKCIYKDEYEEQILNTISRLNYMDTPHFYGDFIVYSLRKKYNVYKILRSVTEKKLKLYFDYLISNYDNFQDIVIEYLDSQQLIENLEVIRINKFFEHYLLVLDELNDETYKRIFQRYTKEGFFYILNIYNSFVIENEMFTALKSKEEVFLVKLYNAFRSKDKNNSNYFKFLWRAANFYKDVQRGVKIYIDEIKKDPCFYKLNAKVEESKTHIRNTLEDGDVVGAESLIRAHQKMYPYDYGLYSISSYLNIIKKEYVEAENNLLQGLSVDPNDVDALFNLAYLYENSEKTQEAVKFYKKAKLLKPMDVNLQQEINQVLDKKIKNYENEKIVNRVLFIDFNLEKKAIKLASYLRNEGIQVDISYLGVSPKGLHKTTKLPFSKIVRYIGNNEMLEYSKFYYQSIWIFNVPEDIRNFFKKSNFLVIEKPHDYINNINYDINKFYKEHSRYLNNCKIDELISIRHTNVYNDITIVIPTYNRPKYLRKLLEYITHYKLIKPKLIILDSSNQDYRNINKEMLSSFSNLNTKYIEFDEKIYVMKKFFEGSYKVDTEYLVYCADDDIIKEEGLLDSINILESNIDLYTIKGRNLYHLDDTQTLVEYDFFNGLYDEDGIERLRCQVKNNFPSLFYQVFRSNMFKDLSEYINLNFNKLPKNDTFLEYTIYFLIIITGKIGMSTMDFNIRDKSVAREVVVTNFPNALIDRTFNTQYMKMKDFITDYSNTIKVDTSNLNKNFEEIFKLYLVNFLRVPSEYIIINNGEFNLEQLTIGMKKSWVWPK